MRILAPALCLLVLAGCHAKSGDGKALGSVAECWSPGTKSAAQLAAFQSVLSDFTQSLPAGMSDSDVSKTGGTMKLQLSDFFVESYDPVAGAADCGAVYAFSYTRPDGTVYSDADGNTIDFEVYQAEAGQKIVVKDDDYDAATFQYQDNSGDDNSGNSSGTTQ